ncbi:MAG: hypothetical protein KAQ69_07990, partial [Spirochaetales bacterium]|nr:hypothetical protein [Spirochaetales bacterium]
VYSDCLGDHGDQPSCMVRSNAWKLMYYSEFDTCLLFNLEEDPMELYDKANDPEYHEIVEKLLARIKARWSAEKMLQGRALEVRDRDLLDHCGHATNSYPVVQELPPEDANQFDFSQLSLNGKSTTLEGEKNDE